MAQLILPDIDKLFRFFQNLLAHSLTLQEMFESDEEIDDQTYHRLKPKHDKFAAEQFEVFYRALYDPEGFAKAVRGFLDSQSKTRPN